MNFENFLFESNDDISKALYAKYKTMFEAPHAEVHDAHNHELLLDMFQEKEGEIRPDKHKHDWIEYLGDLLKGKPVTDFYNQHFNLDQEDIAMVENELVNYYKLLIDLIKIELNANPWKAKFLPFTFLQKLYAGE